MTPFEQESHDWLQFADEFGEDALEAAGRILDARSSRERKVREVLVDCINTEIKRCGTWHQGRQALEKSKEILEGK